MLQSLQSPGNWTLTAVQAPFQQRTILCYLQSIVNILRAECTVRVLESREVMCMKC